MTKKVFKTVKVEEEGFNYLTFLASLFKTKKSALLTRILKEIFSISSDLTEGQIYFDSERGKLIVTVVGRSVLIVGTAPNDEIAKTQIEDEIKRRVINHE